MKACPHCLHNDISKRTCAIGNTDAYNKWWLDNGHKMHNDIRDTMPCFIESEGSKLLKSMIDTVNKLDKLLTDKNI